MIIFVTPGHLCHIVIMLLTLFLSKEFFTCFGFKSIILVSGYIADISHYHIATTGFSVLFSSRRTYKANLATRISALFGVLFSGTNTVVVYQNDKYQICLGHTSSSSSSWSRWAVLRVRIMSWVGNLRSWQIAWTSRPDFTIARWLNYDDDHDWWWWCWYCTVIVIWSWWWWW